MEKNNIMSINKFIYLAASSLRWANTARAAPSHHRLVRVAFWYNRRKAFVVHTVACDRVHSEIKKNLTELLTTEIGFAG